MAQAELRWKLYRQNNALQVAVVLGVQQSISNNRSTQDNKIRTNKGLSVFLLQLFSRSVDHHFIIFTRFRQIMEVCE